MLRVLFLALITLPFPSGHPACISNPSERQREGNASGSLSLLSATARPGVAGSQRHQLTREDGERLWHKRSSGWSHTVCVHRTASFRDTTKYDYTAYCISLQYVYRRKCTVFPLNCGPTVQCLDLFT